MPSQNPRAWLDEYENEIMQECVEAWAANSMTVLRKLEASLGGIEKATPDKISSSLADIAGSRGIATRNRAQSVLSRFFRWAVDTKRMRTNPAERIKRITEPRITDSEGKKRGPSSGSLGLGGSHKFNDHVSMNADCSLSLAEHSRSHRF